MTNIKKRRLFISIPLSLLVPGFGHLYIGQIIKGVILYFIHLIIILLFGLTNLIETFQGFVIFLLLCFSFIIYVLIDIIRKTNKIGEYSLKRYNRWYIYLIILIVYNFLVVPFYYSLVGVRSFRYPTGSMEPTILAGEHFIVKMDYYKTKKVARNDVVLFSPPNEINKQYCKRCVAIAGDEVQIKNGYLYINGKKEEGKYIKGYTTYDGFREKRLEGKVPERTIVVLGDNRQNSSDSRSFGYLPINRIEAKVLFVYWSNLEGRIGTQIQ